MLQILHPKSHSRLQFLHFYCSFKIAIFFVMVKILYVVLDPCVTDDFDTVILELLSWAS